MSVNLGRFKDKYKDAPSEGERLPDGRFQVQVADLTLGADKKNAEHAILKWKLLVIGPSHEGRYTWKDHRIGHDNPETEGKLLGMLKTDIRTCGMSELVDDIEKIGNPDVRAAFLGLVLEIELITTPSKTGGRDFQNVYFKRRVAVQPLAVVSAVGGADGTAAGAVGAALTDDTPF
jgi:hypothetical protein